MRKARRNKLSALLAVAAAAATVGGIGGGVYAYWTTTGTGSGTATDGLPSVVTVVGTAVTPLYPGTSSTVTFTASTVGTGTQSISTIHLVKVDAYPTVVDRTALTNVIATCGGANAAGKDFTMPDVAVNPATDGRILPGATAQVLVTPGTLTMNNLGTNQDTCKGAFLALTFTTS